MRRTTNDSSSGTGGSEGPGLRKGGPVSLEQGRSADMSSQRDPASESKREPATPTEIPSRSWWQISRRVSTKIRADNLTDRAATLTYYGLLALFPALLVLVSLLGFFGHSTTAQITHNLEQVAPGSVKSLLTTTIRHVEGRAGAATVAAIVGLVIALWSASSYVSAFMRASNAVYNVEEGRPAWQKIPTRVGVTAVTMVLLVVSALLVVLTGKFATQAGQAFGIGHTAVTVWDIAKWPILVVLVSFMFSLLYWACPNVKQPGFRWVTPGGLVAVGIWLVASALFALYVSFSSSYSKTYGAFASIIIFLVWLWLTNLSVLIGAEVNAELQHQRAIESGLPPDVDPSVELRSTKKLDDPERERVTEAARQREAIRQDGA